MAHSEEFFVPERDAWYNRDFLALLGRRLGGATAARSLLEVGFGQGHWSATLASIFPALTELVGVDFEARWVAEAKTHLEAKLGALSFSTDFVQADAHALPFEDGRFDVVTCQTVLMHLARPAVAMAELFRVVRPGGLVLVAEPDNLYPFLVQDSATRALGLDARSGRCRLWLAIHEGRARAGRGDWSIGDRLVPLMRACGAQHVRVIQNDRVQPVAPPYDTAESGDVIAFELDWIDGVLGPERGDYRDLAVLGGLTADEAERLLDVEAACQAERRRQVEAGQYTSGGGTVHYLAWGIAP